MDTRGLVVRSSAIGVLEPALNVTLQYGSGGLSVDLSGFSPDVLRPTYPPPIANEADALREALSRPTAMPSLADWIDADHQVAIAIPDITRALPNERLLRGVFEVLANVPAEQFVIVAGTGTHRGHREEEWRSMVGDDIFDRYECIDHDGRDPDTLASAGRSAFGYEVQMNRRFLEADRRLLLGFIEPHFMAGFSGGYKACFPGVAALDTIMHYHSAENIGHPRSTWGLIEGNPTQDHVRAGGRLLPDCFLLNVTLDDERRVTGYFCGDPLEAHDLGCAFCKTTAMQPCDHPYPLVLTCNSGYPLDQNLYQAVKGMSAAAEVVADGGIIVCAARCNDGFPDHGRFKSFLFEHQDVEAMIDRICSPGFAMVDQWQIQKLAVILRRCRVLLVSELPDEEVRRAHLEPMPDLASALHRSAEALSLTDGARLAVLPEGPMTIPYLAN
jgi:nickel-dependent lactate racemase